MLLERVLASVDRTPEAPAVIAADTPVSYRHFRALIARAVTHLRQQGVKPGDVVGLSMAQTPLYLLVFLALGWIGALVVPIGRALRPPERDELIRKFSVGALVTERLEVVPASCRLVQLQSLETRGRETMIDAGEPGFGPDTPLRIALTTGTTGTPRGVLQTHESFATRLDRLACDAADFPRVLAPALHITLAINLAMHALVKGGTVVFPRGYGNDDFFDALGRHAVTHVALPPSNVGLMLAALPKEGVAFPRLRHLRLLGSTPSRALIDAIGRRFSPHVYSPYGIGELGVVAMATPETLREDPAWIGALEPGVRLEVLDGGDVRVFIPGMPTDYYGPDAGKGTRFRDGWFHPGDRGRIDANGRFYLEGRADHLINLGGYKVAPEYVESILMEFAGVREAAVYAIEGAGTTRLAAAIVPAGPLDWPALRAHALARLHVMAPARYLEVASLPRNALGKLERKLVSETNFGQSEIRL